MKPLKSVCQIRGKTGYLAIDCLHIMDHSYQGKHPSAKLAAMATSSNVNQANDPWLILITLLQI